MCYCGRTFNSYRSLNLHRRSCFIQKNPSFAELFAQQDDSSTIANSNESMTEVLFPTDKFKVLSGVKLPRSDLSWKAANEFFQSKFSVIPELGDLDSEIVFMNNVIWSYFKDTCGLVKSANKFEHYVKIKVKKMLKRFKIERGQLGGNKICQ
jgi:hypothetical protein